MVSSGETQFNPPCSPADASQDSFAAPASLVLWGEFEAIITLVLDSILNCTESIHLTPERLYDSVADELKNHASNGCPGEMFYWYEKLFHHFDKPDAPHTREKPNFMSNFHVWQRELASLQLAESCTPIFEIVSHADRGSQGLGGLRTRTRSYNMRLMRIRELESL